MRPPALPRLLVRVLSPADDRVFILQDLDERFAALAATDGERAARRWYWSQVLGGIPWTVRPDGELLRRKSWGGTAGDVRLGLRSLARRPLYTLGVTGTLALGLGSAAVVFAVCWRVWLSPMPFPDPDRVVRVFETEAVPLAAAASEDASGQRWRVSPPLLEDLRANRWATLESVAGVAEDEVDWARDAETARLSALLASPELFSILGVVPRAGRLLSQDTGLAELLLVGDFWQAAFGGDPTVVGGLVLELDGVPHQVVGIVDLPSGYPGDADVVMPLSFTADELTEGMRGARYLDAVARVRPSHSVEEAIAELDVFVGALGEVHPQHDGWGGDAAVLGDELVRPFRGVLALLLAAGATFLVLAVVNVGGLVAARRIEGREERAVRLALGASEGRLLRSSVVESLMLGAAGSTVAVVGASWLLTPMRALVPQDVPRLSEVALDPPLASVVLATGLAVGVLVGVLGYLMSRGTTKRDLRSAAAAAPPGLALRRILVVGQVALTTVLTTGGVAILRYASSVQSVDVGFTAEGVLASPAALSEIRYPTEQSRWQVWEALVEGLGAQGIQAAVATNPPMAGSNMPFGMHVDGTAEQTFAQYHAVTDEYFTVMGIELLDGRAFGEEDHASSPPTLIVSEALAREHFPAGGAVGREIRVVGASREVVGVVRSTRHHGPDAAVQPEMYVPFAQDPWAFGHVLLRTERADAPSALVGVAREVDPELGLPPAGPYTRYLTEWYAPLRLQLLMVGILAILGLALASLGLYALVAYHVSARRREIGIRMALGAPAARLFKGVVGQGIGLGLVGGAAGFGAWYALVPATQQLVDGIDPKDPVVPVLVAAVVGAVCILATLAPAWRSTAVDPVVTLKAE